MHGKEIFKIELILEVVYYGWERNLPYVFE